MRLSARARELKRVAREARWWKRALRCETSAGQGETTVSQWLVSFQKLSSTGAIGNAMIGQPTALAWKWLAGACRWDNQRKYEQQSEPRFSLVNRARPLSTTSTSHFTVILSPHPLPTLNTMNTLPTGDRVSRFNGPPQQGILNVLADHRMTNTRYGDSNSNVGNVSNINTTTINVGIEEESLRIQEWLSPLQPDKRHQDVKNKVNRLWSMESIAVLILSVLPAASYIYTKAPE